MMRSYHHVTREIVESGAKEKHAKQEVVRLVGKISDSFERFISDYDF